MQKSMENKKNRKTSINSLETQIDQIAKQIADQHSVAFNANT